ncbi:TPA: hypothetical protein ACGG8A_003496 [Vibrio cholerae]|uniref:hypothetical protein n=1 Tax=Vibrio TaxID=662 RepID=UPI0011EFA0E0|nr:MULTISPECIES: hypothetical protein [Vibrio]MCD6725271.1 hypothetical protein [Vibrio cholerae]TYW40410.1 hypothetical protein FY553_18370 [Vibrio cholerae]
MTDSEIKELFKIQSRNVRHLKKVEKNLTMDINYHLLKGDDFKVGIKTNFYSLLYSSLSEAQFLQILHTPNGFSYAEIQKVNNKRSIVDKWKCMLDIALSKVGDFKADSDIANKRNHLLDIITTYIENPQTIRNKIAHGQWVCALNSKNTKENAATTAAVKSINVVEISRWYTVHQYLCFIMRDLVQSTPGTFNQSFNENYSKLDTFLTESASWTLTTRINDIKRKYQNRKVQPED